VDQDIQGVVSQNTPNQLRISSTFRKEFELYPFKVGTSYDPIKGI